METLEHFYNILDIKFGASEKEIKKAYYDLAKVWHPDRFPNDPKLQKKAQEKLKEIINAYENLKSYYAKYGPPPHREEKPTDNFNKRKYTDSNSNGNFYQYQKQQNDTNAQKETPRWSSSYQQKSQDKSEGGNLLFKIFAFVLAGVFIVILKVIFLSPESTGPKDVNWTPYTPPSKAKMSSVNKITKNNSSNDHISTNTSNISSYNRNYNQRYRPAIEESTSYQRPNLSSLSYEEKSSIESACYLAKTQGPAKYNRCLTRQMNDLRSAPMRPNLSSLSYEEKSSIESACYLAKTQGPANYNRCLTRQMNDLRSAPMRPNLSSLSYEEKSSIESACYLAKTQGPANYNRCLTRQMQMLRRY